MKSGGAEASSELCILQNQRERKMIKKRKKAVAAALGLLMFAAVPASARDYIMGQTWSFDASSAGYLAAQDRGYFKDNGVSVKVQRGIGASDTLRRLITGDVDFAVFDATLLVRAAAADPAAQLTMVANVLQRSSHTAIYVKGRNVKTVGDLAKAKFGNTGGSVSQLFPTFMTYAMKTVGQPSNAFTSVQLDPALRVPALLRGDIDVIAAFTFEMPLIAARAKESGLELAKFDFADYGMNPYTYGIMVTRKFAESDPAAVRGAVAGVLKGWQWVCQNPAEAAKFIVKYHADVPPETIPDELSVLLPDVGGADVAAHGLGYMNPKRWEETRALSIAGFKLDEKTVPPAASLINTSFLPATPVQAVCK
jgi:NitT/TauT family transport system substrate-binding protein